MGIFGILRYNLKRMKQAKKLSAMGAEALLALDDDNFYDAVECLCDVAVYDINAPELNEPQLFLYALTRFEAEVNNGGLCQFFVNSSSECAPYISRALAAVGADALKSLFDSFIAENGIDVTDLSSFNIDSIDDYEAQTQRFDFDGFDDRFYEDEQLHDQIIAYGRRNIARLLES